MTKLIGICGTHCAGKSTLLEDLYSEIDKDMTIHKITEIARGISRKDRSSIFAQHYIMSCQRREETMGFEENVDLILSDRTSIDNLAYTTLNLQNRENRDRANVLRDCWDDMFKSLERYDGIILVDEYFEIDPKDRHRNSASVWQDWILNFVELLLKAYYTKPVLELMGDRKSRVRKSKAFISDIMNEEKNGKEM